MRGHPHVGGQGKGRASDGNEGGPRGAGQAPATPRGEVCLGLGHVEQPQLGFLTHALGEPGGGGRGVESEHGGVRIDGRAVRRRQQRAAVAHHGARRPRVSFDHVSPECVAPHAHISQGAAHAGADLGRAAAPLLHRSAASDTTAFLSAASGAAVDATDIAAIAAVAAITAVAAVAVAIAVAAAIAAAHFIGLLVLGVIVAAMHLCGEQNRLVRLT
mmetsp:Transcript_25015/g.62498  ORF Transcript_25015/g.62498 Transcript_25015/m.62498 type:complete len:216 (-) Transcript_25015:465-1112(-)